MVLGALLDRLLGQMDEHLGFIPTDPVNRAGRYDGTVKFGGLPAKRI